MPPSVLSKTNFLYGLQCHKYFWKLLYAREEIPPVDEATQFIFDQGHEVGNLAKKLFPDGIDIPTDDFQASIRITKEQLSSGRPLFEANMVAGDICCRVDILNPAGDGAWDIIEVKSAASVKEVNLADVAFQRLCCRRSGLKIGKCKLAYINNKYVKKGEIDPAQLFIIEDITDRVDAVSDGLQEQVEAVLGVMSQEQCPEVAIGPHCTSPYSCPLQDKCWEFLPEHNVLALYYGGNRRFELLENGIQEIKDIPDDFFSNEKQRIQQDSVIKGEAHINREAIRLFLNRLQYPVYYLDFETFATAIPLYDGTHPYQQIPFQFSLHVVENTGAEPRHHMYLAEGMEDPRPALARELKGLLGDRGSIVAYYSPFEEQVLRELAGAFPQYQGWVDSLQPRMLDLYRPFKSFHYYHPEQKGSASLKSVLPAMTGVDYDGLGISNGKVAGVAFLAAERGSLSEAEREVIRENLGEYCGQDTSGMVLIVNKLTEAAERLL
ncbi:MAG: DUF2779 domain-containing protein [Dehalococcoidia bacterium]|nr:DUF2779 domain-containing protein [Dehalococcoidia bacterium]